MAQPIYNKLSTNTPDGYYLVAGIAFPQGTDQIAGHIKATLKSGQCVPNDPAERQKLLLFDWQLLSFCQMAEWGMHALQGSFGHLCIPLNINFSEQCCDLLELCVWLNNVHVQMVGIIKYEMYTCQFDKKMSRIGWFGHNLKIC
jgi:hypothetical protein